MEHKIPLGLEYRLGVVGVGQHGGYAYYACKLYQAKPRADGTWTYRPIRQFQACRSKDKAWRIGKEECPGIVCGKIHLGTVAWSPSDFRKEEVI